MVVVGSRSAEQTSESLSETSSQAGWDEPAEAAAAVAARPPQVQELAELLEQEVQQSPQPDAEYTLGVEEGRPGLEQGRPVLQPARSRLPARSGERQDPREAPPDEHQVAATPRQQVTERPLKELLLQCKAPARHDLKEENPESSEAHWKCQH